MIDPDSGPRLIPPRWSLRVAGIALVVCLGSCHAVQRPSAAGRFMSFTDNQNTQIWTPSATVSVFVADETEVEAGWAADVISSASVDVVSAASISIDETRHEVRLGTTSADVSDAVELGASYSYSFEKDADGHVGELSLGSSLFDESLDLSLRYALAHSRLGTGEEPRDRWRPAWIHNPEIGVDIVLGRATVLELVYSTFVVDGYQASPYRRVPVGSPELIALDSAEEQVPSLRWRNAWMTRVQAGFGGRWLTSLAYRLYVDDWGLLSHTEAATVSLDVTPALTIGLRERLTVQGSADFYQSHYETLTQYRTRDRRLSEHLSALGGAWGVWTARERPDGVSLDVSMGVDVIGWRFDDFMQPDHGLTGEPAFTPLGWVRAFVTHVGIEVRQ